VKPNQEKASAFKALVQGIRKKKNIRKEEKGESKKRENHNSALTLRKKAGECLGLWGAKGCPLEGGEISERGNPAGVVD